MAAKYEPITSQLIGYRGDRYAVTATLNETIKLQALPRDQILEA